MITLEVAYDRSRRRWVVRPFGGDGVKTFANHVRKVDAVKTAATLAEVLG
jgi:hypothetical protein